MIVMNAGRAEQIGTPMEVYEDPQTLFVAGFIGSPAMNFLPAKARRRQRSRSITGGAVRRGRRRAAPGAGGHGRHPPRASATRARRSGEPRGPVEMVEQLGADTLVHVGYGGAILIVARAARPAAAGRRRRFGVDVDPARVFLFDAQSGSAAAR